MAFASPIERYVGMLPILKAAEKLVVDDFAGVLALRCSSDGSTPGPDFVRVQTEQMHSTDYPLVVIEPAQRLPGESVDEGVEQTLIFDVQVYLTASIDGGDPLARVRELTADLIRYTDAVWWLLENATDAQWRFYFPSSSNAGPVRVQCGQGNFAGLSPGSAIETDGMYERSMEFEMKVTFFEA